MPSKEGIKAFCPFHIVRRRALHPERTMDNHSDSEEELAAFCPQVSSMWELLHWTVFFNSLIFIWQLTFSLITGPSKVIDSLCSCSSDKERS